MRGDILSLVLQLGEFHSPFFDRYEHLRYWYEDFLSNHFKDWNEQCVASGLESSRLFHTLLSTLSIECDSHVTDVLLTCCSNVATQVDVLVSKSTGWPYVCIAITALVFEVIFLSTCFGSKFQVSSSESAKTILAPV